MVFGSLALRVVSAISLGASVFWFLAFVWTPIRDPPPVLLVVGLTALLTTLIALLVVRRWPTLLVVDDDTEWPTLLRRLAASTLLAYAGMGVAVYLLGRTVCWLAGWRLEGDTELGLAIMALWAPIWSSPLAGSVLAWRWSRPRRDG